MTKAQWAEHAAYQEQEIKRLESINSAYDGIKAKMSEQVQQVEKALDSMCEQNKELKRVIVQKCLDELK